MSFDVSSVTAAFKYRKTPCAIHSRHTDTISWGRSALLKLWGMSEDSACSQNIIKGSPHPKTRKNIFQFKKKNRLNWRLFSLLLILFQKLIRVSLNFLRCFWKRINLNPNFALVGRQRFSADFPFFGFNHFFHFSNRQFRRVHCSACRGIFQIPLGNPFLVFIKRKRNQIYPYAWGPRAIFPPRGLP